MIHRVFTSLLVLLTLLSFTSLYMMKRSPEKCQIILRQICKWQQIFVCWFRSGGNILYSISVLHWIDLWILGIKTRDKKESADRSLAIRDEDLLCAFAHSKREPLKTYQYRHGFRQKQPNSVGCKFGRQKSLVKSAFFTRNLIHGIWMCGIILV